MTLAQAVPVAVLPPGISEDDFALALDAWRQAVGEAHVRSGLDLADYEDPYPFGAELARAAAAVLPGSVAEVQAVVAVAQQWSIPLWTVSRGRNYGYGGAAPRVDGSVVVDLSRLDRVLEVDEEACFALVEPGVSFSDLHQHLRDIGSSLWVSVPDISWGSVVGNALERGVGYTSGGDHAGHICGLEVVLADGRLLRTGMGAMSDNAAWSMYKGGFGPSLDGLFLQSNYGIVTKVGIWLVPAPEQAVVCTAQAANKGDLGALVDALRPLLIDGTISTNAMIGNALAVASMISDRHLWHDGPGAMPDAAVRRVCDGLHLGWWNARFALYGTAEVVEARLHQVQRALSAVPGLELITRSYPGSPDPATVHPADRAQLGIPSTELIRMAAWRGGEPAHTDFSLVCPPKGEDAERQVQLIQARVEEAGFDYAGGVTLFPRHAIALALISFDRADADERAAVARLFPQLVADAALQHYAPYRAHLQLMDVIAEQYDFNGHAARDVQGLIKDALDPAGILSPGKQGIWPARLRGDRSTDHSQESQ